MNADRQRELEFRRMIRNAQRRLDRCTGCDGGSEMRRRELMEHIRQLEKGAALFRSFQGK